MGLASDVLKEIKEIIQIQGRLDERIQSQDKQIDRNAEDIVYLTRELAKHGERLVALETGRETLQERIMLGVERALHNPVNTPAGQIESDRNSS